MPTHDGSMLHARPRPVILLAVARKPKDISVEAARDGVVSKQVLPHAGDSIALLAITLNADGIKAWTEVLARMKHCTDDTTASRDLILLRYQEESQGLGPA